MLDLSCLPLCRSLTSLNRKATTNLTDVNGGLDLPGWIDILIKRLEQFVEDEAEKDPLLKELEQFFPYLSELAQKAYNYVQANGLPTVSWNHAKMVVVNGTTVTTGGANYWSKFVSKARTFTYTRLIPWECLVRGLFQRYLADDTSALQMFTVMVQQVSSILQ